MADGKERHHGRRRRAFVFDEFLDSYYVEEFDGGMPITHESRDSVVSTEDTTRMEMVSRYDKGFAWEKLTTVRRALRECVWLVLQIAAVLVFYLSTGPYAVTADAPVATINTVALAMLGVIIVFQIRDTVKQLRIVYRLRGIAEETPLNGAKL